MKTAAFRCARRAVSDAASAPGVRFTGFGPLSCSGHCAALHAGPRTSSRSRATGRPCSASSSTRSFQPASVASAPGVGAWSGSSRSTAPPAGTGFRQIGGALSGCGSVLWWGCSRLVTCPCRALFERTRNPAGVQAAAASRCAGVDFRRLHPHRNPAVSRGGCNTFSGGCY